MWEVYEINSSTPGLPPELYTYRFTRHLENAIELVTLFQRHRSEGEEVSFAFDYVHLR
ncbi:MAG: hypothetical protein ACXABY_24875 [Candidatus Thorarchaeota archaeon]|jgi:hypothetical protein